MPEDLASPTAWKRTVPRITPDVVRRTYAKLAKQSSYFIYEEGRDAIRGCALRVLRREVQIGARADRGRTWIKVATQSWATVIRRVGATARDGSVRVVTTRKARQRGRPRRP